MAVEQGQLHRPGFADWVRRERRVDWSRNHMQMALTVRVRRREGTEIQRTISDLQLASSRLAPQDLIALAFPDPIDRIAIQLQARDLLAALPPMQRQVGSLCRAYPQAPPAPRSERYSPRIQARPQRRPEPTPEGAEILAPPSDRLPFYKPR